MTKTIKRNFSFKNSKRLPEDKMIIIGDIVIPAVPGSCYHAILCSLIENKNKFVGWGRLYRLVEKHIVMYGGDQAWKKFAGSKQDTKAISKKIRTNTHTLTRRGTNCYGYRLHERGIAIYYFKDGTMARTGGKFIPAKGCRPYDLKFSDKTGFQVRQRGKIMSYQEYKDLIGGAWIGDEL